MNIIRKNLPIKLLSLFIAFVIWTLITNYKNPVMTDTANVQVDVKNENYVEGLGKVYSIKDSRLAKVTYTINSKQSTQVRQSDFKLYVDLQDLANTNDLTVHCELQNGIDRFINNMNIEPKTLHIELNDIKSSEFRVKYTINGKLENGHSVGSVIYSPTVVYISATDEIIKEISHISIEIPVNDKEEMFSGSSKPRIIGKDGKEIINDKIKLSTEEINYTATIFSSKNIAINANVEGEVRRGCTYEGVEITPNEIVLSGSKSAIERVSSIDLPNINIDNLSENVEYTYSIREILPAGFKCDSTDEIKVRVLVSDYILGPK